MLVPPLFVSGQQESDAVDMEESGGCALLFLVLGNTATHTAHPGASHISIF